MVCLVFDILIPSCKINVEDSQAAVLHQTARKHLEQFFGCGEFDFYLCQNGKLLSGRALEGEVHVIPRLRGGKGGFGSMLRAIGAQIEKTTNREACRDLSGRRLRDINEEKRLKKWIAEQAEREQEALKRKRKKLEKLNAEVKHEFTDEEYTKARVEMPNKIHEAVEQGLQVASEEPTKEIAKPKVNESIKKKPKGNLWVDDLLDDSEASEVDESEEEPQKKKTKLS